MNYKLVKAKFCALLGVLALLALIPSAAFAATASNVWFLGIVTNPPGTVYTNELAKFQSSPYIARWGTLGGEVTNIHLQNAPEESGIKTNIFLTMTNYYVPTNVVFLLDDTTEHDIKTNLWVPYSNTLSVTLTGTNGMTQSVVWSFSVSPAELTNSWNPLTLLPSYQTSYTNNCDLTPIPTGQYTVAFTTVPGWTNNSSAQTNITWGSPRTNTITGTYVRNVFGTITVTVNPTNGSWAFTNYPSDFTNYSSSALSGTNGNTLTNAPAGAYTIHYGTIAGATAPANQTQTLDAASTNLTFAGNYIIGAGGLTVQFLPAAVRSLPTGIARWYVSSLMNDYGPFVHNQTTNLPNYDNYTVTYNMVRDYYKPGSNYFMLVGDKTITNTYLPYTNDLSITTIDERTNTINAPWTIISYPPSEFTNSTAYINSGTNGSAYEEYEDVPTGTYKVAYYDMTGYRPPPNAIQTNVMVGTTNGYFTGSYTRACGTITVAVSQVSGSWSFTTYPTNIVNFTNYTGSALSGTNGGTLTNVPVGVYTIHYYDIGSPYFTPADQTKTNTTSSTNLSFTGTYLTSTQSWLTVFFNPVDVRDTAQWKPNVALSPWYYHLGSAYLNNGSDYLVYYSAVKDYYLPSTYTVSNLFGDTTITNTYVPYSNSLSVVITGITDGATSTWQIAQFANFTNSRAYKARYTNSQDLSLIPTGSYVITFNDVYGYTEPAGITTNIASNSPMNNSITGLYTRLTNGAIRVTANVTNAAWVITNSPVDYTGVLTGGGTNTVITNVPVGTYAVQFSPVPGFTTPGSVTRTVNNNVQDFPGIYGYGWRLTVYICSPGDPVPPNSGFTGGATPNYPASIGYGTYDINTAAKAQGIQVMNSWYFNDSAPAVSVDITATPTNYSDGVHTYTSVYYKAYSRYLQDDNILYGYTYTTYIDTQNPIEGLLMNGSYDVWLLFSRVKNWYENVTDLDADGLPDEWEKTYGLNPESALGTNGAAGNPDDDWIPSTSTNAPMRVTVSTNLTTYLAGSGADPGYPLRGTRLYNPLLMASDGYARTNIPFDNLLECRGLDGYYKTSGANGLVTDDDPRTSPTVFDTFQNRTKSQGGISDGWRYYFWYWRSKSSYDAGLTNASANLDWVTISPSGARASGGSDMEHDTDGDGLADLQEYADGADPTHADTDADGMDDYWEINRILPSANSNALDSANWSANPDGDFYATVSNLFVLTNGMVGTAFTNAVCHNGPAATPVGAWVNIYTNTGSNVFDLYWDTIIKATVALTNRQTGTIYTNTVYYGTNAGLGAFKQGYPVYVDVNGNTNYDAGVDVAIINPPIKHALVYCMPPAAPAPGVTSFDPRTAWTNIVIGGGDGLPMAATNTAPYTTYQEYLGGDYIGRLSWDAGGQRTTQNDPDVPTDRNNYTLPTYTSTRLGMDSDADLIPDGWELYVGLNPNSAADAGLNSDGDYLINGDEWANAMHALGSCAATWPNKHWPTDPGVIVAPSPNDPHPTDTDWDGLGDSAQGVWPSEQSNRSNPTGWDTDNDGMPDGWEVFYGAIVTNVDADLDYDGDGLSNIQEYWTSTVDEWQYCDATWGLDFRTRARMAWDNSNWEVVTGGLLWFVPPDYLTCPSFLYLNGIYTIDWLRTNYPANNVLALDGNSYHTTRADNPDSDRDGMDDYWEVYHGLNPLQGYESLTYPNWIRLGDPYTMREWHYWIGNYSWDADPSTPGFQFGLDNAPFNSAAAYFAYMRPGGTDPWGISLRLFAIAGPFNFGMDIMDPDGDGLPNLEEYSYDPDRPFYHTDPTPFWRTDENDPNSFVNWNYDFDYHGVKILRLLEKYPFDFEMSEGFDTDNDGKGDYAEINAAAGELGNNPRDSRNPIRNRALYLNGTNDFVRTLRSWFITSPSVLTKFCVEAWVKPNEPARKGDFVIVEKAGLYRNPYNLATNLLGANFRLGITNGLPYIRYNGRGALRAYQATAKESSRPQANAWFHLAGTYDGAELTIYVNGEASATLLTTELPATGFNAIIASGSDQSLVVGASDLSPGTFIPDEVIVLTNYFGGCIDEVRVWDGTRTRGQILQTKNQRLPWGDMTNTLIHHYYTFDDVPDPLHRNSASILDEPVAPFGLTNLDMTMSFHPPITWWKNYPLCSIVYYGLNGAYNYIVSAEDHAAHRAQIPPMDDFYHFSSNYMGTNANSTPSDYLPIICNPYNRLYVSGRNWITDLYFFKGARAVATNSWLDGLDPNNPDSTDTDGDGLPDWWEQLYGLDPNDATGDNGAWGDPDNDGLNNRAEYLAGTDPRNSDTFSTGVGDYDYPRGVYSRTYGEMFTDGDGMPDDWESQYGLDPQKYDANLDLDGDGWSNYAEYQAGTEPNNASSHPQPTVSGLASYYGRLTGTLQFQAYGTNTMDGVPMVQQAGTGTVFSLTGFKEGDFYLMAFLDANGNGSFNTGEPMGIMDNQPAYLSYSSITDVRVRITDTRPGFGRFAWTAATTTGTYPVAINKISENGAPTIIQRAMTYPRNYFHEWDFQLAGIEGLMAGTYQWWMGSQNGTFSVNWPTSLAKPALVYPRGDVLYNALNQFAWTMDLNCSRAHFQVERLAANGSLTLLTDKYIHAPWMDAQGVFRGWLDDYASDWGNGVYYWRVAGWTPQGESAWSDKQTFNVNLSATNSRWVSGDIDYFGKAPATKIIVEAFDNRGFGGRPAARLTLTPAASTNWVKCSYTLRGLKQGTYYMRAFLDVDPAGSTGANNQPDTWESVGFYRDTNSFYQAGLVDLSDAQFMPNAKIIIRDKDTDNDKLPDAWEMAYFGNLDQTGDMDYDGDGESNLDEYIKDGVNQNPAVWDTDGDGLADGFESRYNGAAFGFAMSAKAVSATLNPTAWDTDGDGYSDGAEVLRYHTNPLDPTSYPRYRPLCKDAWSSPGDYDGDGRSDVGIYDFNAGVWSVITMAGQSYALPFGIKGAQPMVSDYDGDGRTDFSFYDKGFWTIYFTRSGQFGSGGFGDASMLPAPADYTGDGRVDLAVFDTDSGTWYIYDIWNGALITVPFGASGMIPVPGDYNGDGAADFVLYEPATGYWLLGCFHKYYRTWTTFGGTLGGPTWMPVPGDYDGDGRNDVCLFEANTGRWVLFTLAGQFLQGTFGWKGCVPVPGDYDGDGRTDLVIYDTNTGMWYIYCMSGAYCEGRFGGPGSLPILKGR